MPSPRPAAPADLAARRRRLLALHRRHAGRIRAVFYWLGADLEVIDGAVLRTFVLADRHAEAAGEPVGRVLLGRLAWRVASRGPADEGEREAPVLAPRLPLAADLLARFLATHAIDAEARAALVLAELCGLTAEQLASELHRDPAAVRHTLTTLRQALLADPEVAAAGGPGAVLAASVAPFERDDEWQDRHAALLLAHARAADPPGLSDMLRRPPAIVGLGAAMVALLLLLRPDPAAPVKRVAPVAVAVPVPAPPVVAPPPPLPVPPDMSPAPAPVRKVARKRGGKAGADRESEALAKREKLAQARDPGAIIVELEMLGAGRKSLPANPRQALAYADQHARDYPGSQLAAQRAELRVRALCALGRRDEARAEANRRQVTRVQDALREACK